MTDNTSSGAGPGEPTCRYGSSRLRFRGPPRPLDGRHIAFVGGNETLGRSLAMPFPHLLEEALGEVCVNFGQLNASVDAALHDPLIANACRDAVLTVVAVTGAANLSNRLYAVHPRRNDRFIKPSGPLRTMFPEVDFSDICFTRHLLSTLHAASPERFGLVREELQAAWVARMRGFLERIGPNVLLTWFAPSPPPDDRVAARADPLGPDPLFVTKGMLAQVRPLVRELVVVPSVGASNAPEVLGLSAHRQAAEALAGPIRAAIGPAWRRRQGRSGGSLRPWPATTGMAWPSGTNVISAPFRVARSGFGEAPVPFPPTRTTEAGLATPPAPRRSVAVLPFAAPLAAEEDRALAELLTEDLTEALFGCPGLEVKVPPALADGQVGLSDLGRLARPDGLAFLIGGSLRVVDGEIRVTARLLDLERGSYVWVRHVDKPRERSVRVLEGVAGELAAAVLEAVGGWPGGAVRVALGEEAGAPRTA